MVTIITIIASDHHPASSPPGRLLVLTLVLVTTTAAVVSSLGGPLAPSIAGQFDVSLATAYWTLSVPLLCGAMASPVLGRVGVGRARRPTVVVALALVTLAGAVAAVAPGFGLFVVARLVQGLGLGLIPLAIAIARDAFPAPRVPGMVAMLSVTTIASAGLGYPLSGLAANAVGVRGAYWCGAGITLLTLLLALLVLPHDRSGPRPGGVDWLGAALLACGTSLLLLVVNQGPVWPAAVVTALLVLGALALLVFGAWTLRSTQPLVDLRLAARRGVAVPNLTGMLGGVGMYALLALAVVQVQADPAQEVYGLGLSVAAAGLVLLPYSAGSVIGSRWALAVRRRHGDRALLPLGSLVFAAGSLQLAIWHDQYWQTLLCLGVCGIGGGFTFSALAVLMVPHVPPEGTASALAFNQVLRTLGFATGSAAGVVVLDLLGGGGRGFTGTLLLIAGLWTAIAVGTLVAGGPRRAPTAPATSD